MESRKVISQTVTQFLVQMFFLTLCFGLYKIFQYQLNVFSQQISQTLLFRCCLKQNFQSSATLPDTNQLAPNDLLKGLLERLHLLRFSPQKQKKFKQSCLSITQSFLECLQIQIKVTQMHSLQSFIICLVPVVIAELFLFFGKTKELLAQKNILFFSSFFYLIGLIFILMLFKHFQSVLKKSSFLQKILVLLSLDSELNQHTLKVALEKVFHQTSGNLKTSLKNEIVSLFFDRNQFKCSVSEIDLPLDKAQREEKTQEILYLMTAELNKQSQLFSLYNLILLTTCFIPCIFLEWLCIVQTSIFA